MLNVIGLIGERELLGLQSCPEVFVQLGRAAPRPLWQKFQNGLSRVHTATVRWSLVLRDRMCATIFARNLTVLPGTTFAQLF